VGKRLVRNLSIYIDTHIVIWLCEGRTEKLTPAASEAIESSEVEISPVVLIELEYLFEIKRIVKPPMALVEQLETQIGLRISKHPFPAVAQTALFETWTPDPFDRIIVAQARSDAYSGLVTADENIQEHYSKTIWNVKSS
jgi:PIN domain nuclease of toxin-antitoxin system